MEVTDVTFLTLLLPVLGDELPARGRRGIDVNDPLAIGGSTDGQRTWPRLPPLT